jgi:hypothetical protein
MACGHIREMAHQCITSLDELVELMQRSPQRELYVRWTRDPQADLDSGSSRDKLTGVPLPGLSANSLAVEPWWEPRERRTWVARRLYDYRHLAELRGPDTRPWIFDGTEVGRGPDNEPLVSDCSLVAEVSMDVLDEAVQTIDALPSDWGSLRRD